SGPLGLHRTALSARPFSKALRFDRYFDLNKLAFWLSFAFLLLASIFFGIRDQLGAMSLTVLVGAVGMAFSSLDKFSKIKAAGFEAELKRAVEEAYATTSSVKELALE